MNRILAFASLLLATPAAFAQGAAPKIDTGDTAWVLISTALVLLMTPGLAFFYAGMVRTKNTVTTLFQNFSALAVVGLLWAVCGYTMTFGKSQGGFIGGFDFFMLNGVGQEPNADYSATIPHALFMLFQCMFAVITPILFSGTIAERVRFKPFMLFIALWSLLVYAPVGHWVWGVGGWLRDKGALDFAGGMVVHMTAGFSAITLAYLMGPRRDFNKVAAKPYDVGMIMIGTALLWFGWFGFNAGSALGANGLAAHAFGTTFFASAAAFFSWMVVDTFRKGKPSMIGAGIGAVAGLVTITPAAGFVSFSSAIIMGLACGFICNYAVSFVKETLKLDDTLDVWACHGVGGTLGILFTGLFASKAVNPAGNDGLFNGNPGLLVNQFIGVGAVIGLAVVGTFVLYKVVNAIAPMQASEHDEKNGLDHAEHDECINSNFEQGQSHTAQPKHRNVA